MSKMRWRRIREFKWLGLERSDFIFIAICSTLGVGFVIAVILAAIEDGKWTCPGDKVRIEYGGKYFCTTATPAIYEESK